MVASKYHKKGLTLSKVTMRKYWDIKDSGYLQDTKNNNFKLLHTLGIIDLNSHKGVTYFEEKNNEENTKIVDMKAYEENTNNSLLVISTHRNSSYSLKNLPFF